MDNFLLRKCLKQRLVVLLGHILQLPLCGLPYASLRLVYYSLHGNIICRIYHKTHIAYHVLCFLTLIKAESGKDLIRYMSSFHCIFKKSGLSIGSVKHRKIIITAVS